MIPIEKDVPAPAPRSYRGPKPKYPFREMAPGDSFFAKDAKRTVISVLVSRMRKLHPDQAWKYEAEGTGYRVWRIALVLGTLAAATHLAHANPPPVGSEDWEIMSPHAEWIKTQHSEQGNWCCDYSDGRPVDVRINADGHWEAHVTPRHWEHIDGAPDVHDHWIVVPDYKVIRQPNPTGWPILWYNRAGDSVYCFSPASGT